MPRQKRGREKEKESDSVVYRGGKDPARLPQGWGKSREPEMKHGRQPGPKKEQSQKEGAGEEKPSSHAPKEEPGDRVELFGVTKTIEGCRKDWEKKCGGARREGRDPEQSIFWSLNESREKVEYVCVQGGGSCRQGSSHVAGQSEKELEKEGKSAGA